MIRPLTPPDYPEIERMLKEDFNQENRLQFLKSNYTFVLDDDGVKGFFTYYLFKGCPMLKHFLVFKNFRTPDMKYGRKLIKEFKNIIKNSGFKNFITSANEDYVKKFIEYYFKVKSNHSLNNENYYLVEV